MLVALGASAQQDTVQVEVYHNASKDTIIATPQIDTSELIGQRPLDMDSASIYKRRGRLVGLTSIGLYGGTLIALNEAWYSDFMRTSFHTFNDNAEWKQVDKVGHSWSAYQLSRLTYGAWKWAGANEKKAVLMAGISGPGFLTVIEILDGFSAGWGWSWGDMGANLFGGGLFVGQQLGWKEQRIDYKFSFHRINYPSGMLADRAKEQFGSSLAQRGLKDYNGQTYWLSANLHSFFKQSRIPEWLNIAIGYGADGMLGAMENKWTLNNVQYTRYDIPRVRQWYLSPDIRWSRLIKSKSKFMRTVCYVLDGIKFPLPGLELRNGKVMLRGLLF